MAALIQEFLWKQKNPCEILWLLCNDSLCKKECPNECNSGEVDETYRRRSSPVPVLDHHVEAKSCYIYFSQAIRESGMLRCWKEGEGKVSIRAGFRPSSACT